MTFATRPITPADHLLTMDEAAEFLAVPPRWLKEVVRLRQIRCTRLGKHIRFRLEHLEEFIAAHEQPVTSTSSAPLRSVPSPRSSAARAHL